MWAREQRTFSNEHRVVRFDLRGYGGSSPATQPFSYVRDVRSLVDHLRLDRPMLVGASMGGAFAINYALEHPNDLRGLLLVAPGISGGFEPPFEPAEQAAFEADEKQSGAIAGAWARHDLTAAIEGVRSLWCPALEGEALRLFRTMVTENAEEVLGDRSALHAERSPPAAARLSSIRVPTTVLVGDRDNPASAYFARRIAKGIPGAKLVEVSGADHLLNLGRPDAFDAGLRSVLSRSH